MNPFRLLWQWLQPPDPVELGRSDSNALPMRELPNRNDPDDVYTWDDWEEEVQAKYPIRYWITNTLPYRYFHPYRRSVSDWWYKLTCHLLPSRRFHLIDLRNPGPGITYTHGWRDKPDTMLWAWMVLLREYVEEEEPRDPASWASPEELAADEGLAAQKREYDEALAIYDWWMRGRVEEEREEQRLYEETKQHDRRSVENRMAVDAWLEYRRFREGREDEMLQRLIAIRRRLWT